MTIETESHRELQAARLGAVQKLTDLNAQHIRSQGRLAGIEIEIAHYHESLNSVDTTDEVRAEIERLNREYSELIKSRENIDRERDALDLELQTIDQQISSKI